MVPVLWANRMELVEPAVQRRPEAPSRRIIPFPMASSAHAAHGFRLHMGASSIEISPHRRNAYGSHTAIPAAVGLRLWSYR
jgi:hypothetical protein